MASSVTVFVVASILFFIIGFLCGYFCRKERKTADHEKQSPYSDDVLKQCEQDQELELKETAAYDPL